MINLNFLGIGSAFNVRKNNNSCFFLVNKDIVFIDCGSNIFKQILEKNVLNGVENIYVILTHLHGDHSGSLADFILYNYFVLNKKTNIIFEDKINLNTLLKLQGVQSNQYTILKKSKYNDYYEIDDYKIKPLPTPHVDDLNSYSYVINNKNETIFYSGDTSIINEGIYSLYEKGVINKIYQDVSCVNSGVHLYIDDFIEYCKNIKNKKDIHIMHIDNLFEVEKRLKEFTMVKSI